jgi:ABC-2 type transport system ATP-binding protein
MNEHDPIIEIEGLVHRYGDPEVLHGIDLEVAKGEIFGFLGHNGAGKTTPATSSVKKDAGGPEDPSA